MNTKNLTSAFWRRFEFKFLAGAGALIGLIACAGQVPRPSPAQRDHAATQWPDVTKESLNHGRSLYIARCSGCHTLKIPQAYPAAKWPKAMDKMAARAKINDAEKELILRYVLTMAEAPPLPQR